MIPSRPLASHIFRGEYSGVMLPLAANPFDDPVTKWMVICAVVLTLIYAVFRSGFRKKSDPLEHASGGRLSQQRAIEREMSNVLVELSEMARQITAQLDSRSAKLEVLIEEADRRIAKLNEAAADSPAGACAGQAASVAGEPVAPVEARYQMIYDLADQALSVQQIARQLGRPRGEIELILALREKVGGAGSGRS